MSNTPQNYRDKLLLIGPRLVLTDEDYVEIQASASGFAEEGGAILPNSITLTAILHGDLAGTIDWKKDGVNISGQTSTSLLVSKTDFTSNSASHSYTVTVTVQGGLQASASKTLLLQVGTLSSSINPSSISVSTQSDGTGGTYGQSLQVTTTSGAMPISGWTYAWSATSGITLSSSTANPTTITGMTIDSGTITCSATKSGYATQTISATISKNKQGLTGAGTTTIYTRSVTQPTTPAASVSTPAGWSATVPTGTDILWYSIGSKASGATNYTWGTPLRAEGTSGTSGKQTLTGYVYWSSTSAGQSGPALTSATYTFSTNSFDSLNGWSQTVTFNAGGTNLAKSFTVTETTAGSGSGTATFSAEFTHTSFNGLVTFTNLSSALNGTTGGDVTYIDGGKITAGTITGRKIRTADTFPRVEMENPGSSFPHTFTGYSASGLAIFKLTAVPSGGYQEALTIDNVARGIISIGTEIGVWGFGDNYAGVLGTSYGASAVRGNSTTGTGVRGESSSGQGGYFSGGEGVRAIHPSASVGGSAIHAETAFGAGVYAIGTTHDFYAGGPGTNYGPFTGSHDGILALNISILPGDIVVDSGLVSRRNVSNTIFNITPSSQPNQKAAIGVFVFKQLLDLELGLPSALTVDGYDLSTKHDQDQLPYLYAKNWYMTNAPTSTLINNVYWASFNAVGEGQVNVCGENGNIDVGDLIVTSSIPGKGMKQADGIVRNYTVAKSREAVTFSSPTEVKMIACIYLCG